MSKSEPKKCLFCGSTRAITKEHVLPKNWQRAFGDDPFDRIDEGWRLNPAGEAVQADRTVRAKPFSRWVREVCKLCNEGWMSRLEDTQAGPLVQDMAKGRVRSYSSIDLAHVARWVGKTAIMIEALTQMRRASGQDQRDSLREGKMPPRLQAWALPFTEGDSVYYHATGEALVTRDGAMLPYFITSIAVLKVHFLAIHYSEGLESTFFRINLVDHLGAPLGAATHTQAWPPSFSDANTSPMLRHRRIQHHLMASVISGTD